MPIGEFSTEPRVFSKEEKLALIFLIVAGIGGLFFGVKYLGKNLEAPFVVVSKGGEYLTSDKKKEAEALAMQSRDTDGDTLNDYDEIYVYKTSAYLADSDSDGFTDASELTSGNDPNCPTGKECGGAPVEVAAGTGVTAEPPTFDFGAAQGLLDNTTPDTSVPQEEMGTLTASQLREMLLKNGADAAAIAKISDDDLLKMYADVLQELQAQKP